MVIVKLNFNKIALILRFHFLQNFGDKKFNDIFWGNPDDFWENLIVVSRILHDIIPTSSCGGMLKILSAANIYIPLIETKHAIHISDNIKVKIANLYEITEKTTKDVERKRKLPTESSEWKAEPPNDFREISVYPSAAEITINESPFLRPNIVDRPYENINQYLDIQFRLLREDFVRPLREGICRYLKEPTTKKIDNIKIYPIISFLCSEQVNEQNCYRIQFDWGKNKMRKVNYEQSRRFIFGSLLCFTPDNFMSILFGKVVQRDVKDLEKGQLIIGFDDNIILPSTIFVMQFLMVESSVFFEPYYHVLNVLKKMDVDKFPMERYIIKVQTDVRPPEYLLNIDPQYFNIENDTFFPLDWGDRTFYNLNKSQEKAFKAALTQEFVIIQGPPGTGKTFLGLKLAKTLIENRSVWYENSPILVICFTNHALDQFLEGLMEATDNIIRVGGQSKNKNLDKFNIRKQRFTSDQSVRQKRIEVQSRLSELKNIDKSLELIDEGKSLLQFSVFASIVPSFQGSTLSRFTNNEIHHWLFSGIDRRNYKKFKFEKQVS